MEIYSLFTRNVREPGCAVHSFSHVRYIPGWECFHMDSTFVFLLCLPSYWCPYKPFQNINNSNKARLVFKIIKSVAWEAILGI